MGGLIKCKINKRCAFKNSNNFISLDLDHVLRAVPEAVVDTVQGEGVVADLDHVVDPMTSLDQFETKFYFCLFLLL